MATALAGNHSLRPIQNTSHDLYATIRSLVPAKYALRLHDGRVDFLEVVERAGGRKYINRIVGAPGDWRRIPLNLRLQLLAARHIAEDTLGALKLFADEHNRCGKCSSPLSDPVSRALGLGPDCRKAYGL